MTSKEQTESRARRLVACQHFQWLPGMDDPREGTRPNLDDPGTLGCIEHALLPAAWPGCAITVMRWTAHDGEVLADVYIQDYRMPCAERFSIGYVPLAEALVAALEAAP